MDELKWMKEIAYTHLTEVILPFWMNMKDEVYGGYYGLVNYDLSVDKKAIKGCILHSRILWFFTNAYMTLKDESLLAYANHAFEFIKTYCIDSQNGGIYWAVNYDGTIADGTKHTYNQAFAVYALSSYYDATKNMEALNLAKELICVIETKCTDEVGYLEAFNREFQPVENDKLSENGVIAEKTMNTLLHVFEAYTENYRVTKNEQVKQRLMFIMDTIADKIYNKELHRQEVFFDKNMNSILDLHSYGHDIETSWLIDRGCEILGDASYTQKMLPITKALARKIFQTAYRDHSLLNECDRGVVNTSRLWWVQAEAVLGFYNAYQMEPGHLEYLDASKDILSFIMNYMVDKRDGSEWFWEVDKDGVPFSKKPIVEPWKCPYHNGRMCFELIRRIN